MASPSAWRGSGHQGSRRSASELFGIVSGLRSRAAAINWLELTLDQNYCFNIFQNSKREENVSALA